jgi:hypothetical protein
MADVKKIFKGLFPFIALGASAAGPIGSMAASALGKALGVDVTATPDGMTKAITAAAQTEEGMLKLQQAENDFKATMTKLGYDHEEKLAELLMEDRDSARKREMAVKDRMPAILAIGALVAFVSALFLLIFYDLPASARDTVIFLLGILAKMIADVYGYYFGSSKSGDAKADVIADIAKMP